MDGKKIAIIGGAGILVYALFRDQFQFAATGSPADAMPAPAPAATTTQQATVPAASASSASLLATIAAAAAGDAHFAGGKGSFDRWNYYYNRTAYGQAYPAPGIERAFPGLVRGSSADMMTIETWWAGVKPFVASAGLSGLARRRAWGRG